MPIRNQIQRLIDLGVHPDLVPASRLTPLLTRAGKPGFVVVDMPDVDEFVPVPEVDVPDQPLYLLREVDRGDDLLDWSPEEAAPVLAERGRSPLTISEGISWLLQDPERLEPGHCFMCIASRRPKPKGVRRPHAGDLDQRWHRPRRQGGTQRPQGRLVLVAQPPHVARVRLGRRTSRGVTPRD